MSRGSCIAVLLALVACKTSTGTVDTADASADDGLPFDLTELATAICEATQTCMGSPMASDCVAKTERTLEPPAPLLPTQRFDPAAYAQCVAAYRAYAANGCGPEGIACGHYFDGTVPPGGACTNPADCAAAGATGVRCDGGQCHVFNYFGCEGQACNQISPYLEQQCHNTQVELYCSGGGGHEVQSASEKGTCEKIPAGVPLGASCTTAACADDVVCDRSTSAPTCVARQPVGAPCVIQKSIFPDEDNCIPGAYCSSAVCVAMAQLHEPCGAGTRCQTHLQCLNAQCRYPMPSLFSGQTCP
jgi:hypothetical protein